MGCAWLMRMWRLSGSSYAYRFDGGFGRLHDGRWNTRGHPITYCATGPALCLLEKLAHIEDAGLLPDDTVLVRYEVPDDLRVEQFPLDSLPDNWRANAPVTQSFGNLWLDRVSASLLRVPSVIVPVPDADDRNILVNHQHEDASRIAISSVERFEYDPRLFDFG